MQAAPARETDLLTVSPRAAIFASALVLVASIDSQMIGAIAPAIADGLGTAGSTVAASVGFYAVAAATMAIVLSRWSRRLEPAAWLPGTAVLFALSAVMAALAPNVAVFSLARVLAGAAGGLISALAIAALANASSYAKRGKQMTGVAVSYFLAPVLGVPLGAIVADRLGWRVLFLLIASGALVVGSLVWRHSLAVPVPESADRSPASLWDLATRSRSAAFGIIGAFFVSGGLVAFTTYLGTWLAEAFGADTDTVGLVYAVAGIGAVAGGAVGGTLADRFGKRRLAAFCSVVMAGLLLSIPWFEWGLALFVVIGATAVAAALRVAPLQALVTELVGGSERAAYIALRNAGSQLGIATGVAAAGWLYAFAGMEAVAWLCSFLSVIAWVSTLALREPDSRPTERSS